MMEPENPLKFWNRVCAMNNLPKPLTSLSIAELEALAESKLAPAAQKRLDELLERNRESSLLPDEVMELDRLVAQVDQLTIIKARARHTLAHTQPEAV
jgi:hypothetical protein